MTASIVELRPRLNPEFAAATTAAEGNARLRDLAIPEAPPAKTGGIKFLSGKTYPNGTPKEDPWIAVNQTELRRMAIEWVECDMLIRLKWLAQAVMDRDGHAPFGPDEIIDTLLVVDVKTGELKRASKSTVYRAISHLVEKQTFAEGSSPLCIRLNPKHVQRAAGRRHGCAVCGSVRG